jgi:hypothetical protein
VPTNTPVGVPTKAYSLGDGLFAFRVPQAPPGEYRVRKPLFQDPAKNVAVGELQTFDVYARIEILS